MSSVGLLTLSIHIFIKENYSIGFAAREKGVSLSIFISSQLLLV